MVSDAPRQRWPLIILVLLAGLGGCAYRTPATADVGSPTYQADLAACKDTVPALVNAQNAKTAPAWFSSPVRRWGQISRGIGACMTGKGHIG